MNTFLKCKLSSCMCWVAPDYMESSRLCNQIPKIKLDYNTY